MIDITDIATYDEVDAWYLLNDNATTITQYQILNIRNGDVLRINEDQTLTNRGTITIANTGSSMNTDNRYVAGVQAGGTITNIGSITISDSCFIDNSNANTGQAGGAIRCCPTTN